MEKYESNQAGKIVTAYGGSGSLVESYKHGCFVVKPFDQWPFYRARADRNGNLMADFQNSIVEDDPKALAVIRELGYTNVVHFFNPPLNEISRGNVVNPNNVLGAEVFPKWFFCPQCHRLRHIDHWRNLWDEGYQALGLKQWNDCDAPFCIDCAQKSKARKKYFRLEQMRFVAASENSGRLIDIPWDVLSQTTVGVEEVAVPVGGREVDANGQFINRELHYTTTSYSDNLEHMRIKTGSVSRSLGDLTRIAFRSGGNSFRMVIRTASNVYQPMVFNSLYVPLTLKEDLRKTIDSVRGLLSQDAYDQLIDALCVKNPGQAILIRRYAENHVNMSIEESEKIEFRYITSNERVDERSLKCERVAGVAELGIKHLYNIRKLREISVLYGYKRMDGDRIWNVAEHPGSVNYMPCVERFGEGILVELDEERLKLHEDKKTIVHTFAHTLIKEMEFECGYDASSFKEKIYLDEENNKYGFIVYCVAGADGSMGGLTSLFNDLNKKIHGLIRNAIDRIKMCPHDPICSVEKGHCFACLDLSEVTCRENNTFLNRQALVDFCQQ